MRRNTNIDRHFPEILNLYLNNFESTVSLGRKFGVCASTITNRLKQNGISVRFIGNLTGNHTAFDEITPNVLYWLGYLAGDGCITMGANGRETIVGIRSIDKEHIEKFLEFVSSNVKITDTTSIINGKKCVGYIAKFSSPEMAHRLVYLGIIPRKSKTITMQSQSLVSTEDFLRGIIDSDGSLTVTTDGFSPTINIYTGSKKFSEQLSTGFREVFGEKCGIYYDKRGSGTYRIALCGKRILPILYKLYCGDSIALNRKKNSAVSILERFGYAKV